MQGVSRASKAETRRAALWGAFDLSEASIPLAVAVGSALAFGFIFNRETTLSYSIGYNLYAAQRVLAGEVPYRDFHTLYPPGVIYLNALIFQVAGTSLYNALAGVYVFKVLTITVLYLCGRQIMSRSWALSAAFLSLFWLRPNGPFKAVPMHYGALLLAVALYYLLKHQQSRKNWALVAAGAALAGLTLFKHNIGIYALLGAVAYLFIGTLSTQLAAANLRRVVILCAGVAAPLALVSLFFLMKEAFVPMVRTLLFGPGEFLLGRLAASPSPLFALGFVIGLVAALWLAYRVESRTFIIPIVAAVLFPAALLVANQAWVDSLIFYLPILIIVAAFLCAIRSDIWDRHTLFLLTVTAAAALMEVFPRFAREQAIAATPFVILLLSYALSVVWGRISRSVSQEPENPHPQITPRLAVFVLPAIFICLGARMVFSTYFDSTLHPRSDTQLNVARGVGVYFPSVRAREINAVVAYIQERVPPGGYFFPHSYAASSFLFLADRNNPSAAQFWGGVGVTQREREETLWAIERLNVALIVTSEKDLMAERYQPLRDYIDQNFEQTKQIDEVLILERKRT